MKQVDARTKLALGLLAVGAVFLTKNIETLIVELIILFILPFLLGMEKALIRLSRLIWPMVSLIFIVAWISFDIQTALLLSVRVLNLLATSFLFFRFISPVEMGDALKKMGMPYGFAFIFTTAMRYVPLIGQKARNIMDAQVSRGIDLRPRLKNINNFLALLMPLLIQSFILSDELAIAMESRGFGRKGRSSRREYHMTLWEYGLITLSLVLLIAFAWWERGIPGTHYFSFFYQ